MNSNNISKPPLDLFISSSDINTDTPHDFQMQSASFSMTTATYNMVLQSISFPNLYPTIKAGVNDTLEITFNNNVFLLVLPEGYYDGVTFASLLQTAIRATDPSMLATTVIYSTVSTKLVFSFPVSSKFTNTSGKATRMAQMCGIDLTKAEYATSYTTPFGIRLHGTSYVDVCVNSQLNSYHTSPGGFNVIARVFFHEDDQFRKVISREYQVFSKGQIVSGDFFQRMRITLVDEWQQPFVIPSNFNVAFHFVLFPLS